jgi:hypothetical protein
MTKEQFDNLEVGNIVAAVRNPKFVLNVVEICEEERFITQWRGRGYPSDLTRIIKLEEDKISGKFCYHNWVCDWNSWDII